LWQGLAAHAIGDPAPSNTGFFKERVGAADVDDAGGAPSPRPCRLMACGSLRLQGWQLYLGRIQAVSEWSLSPSSFALRHYLMVPDCGLTARHMLVCEVLQNQKSAFSHLFSFPACLLKTPR
jgi:hypothetical protein